MLARKMFQHVAHMRVALEAAPPLEAQQRFYGPGSSVAQNRMTRPSNEAGVYLKATVCAAATQAFSLVKSHLRALREQGAHESPEATKDQPGEWTRTTAAQGSHASTGSARDDGGKPSGEPAKQEGTDEEAEGDDAKLLESIKGNKAQVSTALMQGKDDDPTVIPPRFAFTPAVGEGLFRASCEGLPKPCGSKRSCLHCQHDAARDGYDSFESKAAVVILRERLTTDAGTTTLIDFDQPLFEVVMAISRHLRYKEGYRVTSWDKMLSKYGAVPVALSRVKMLVATEGLGRYYVARRRRRISREIEYGVYEDLGNFPYSDD